MNTQPSPLWTHLTSEGRLTGTWRAALPAYQNRPSPCLGACPVGGRIAEWIRQIGEGDHYGAFVTLTDNNPFPAIAGRICHHPCETACNRREWDETVGICSLERFIGDKAIAEGWAFPAPAVDRDASVAVIGGGPAGLSAAYQLRRAGFRVTLYEAAGRLGGLMRSGIPAYRLDPAVLEAEIDRILAMGLDIRLNAEIAGAEALAQLRDDHDAVFLATGASLPKRLPGLDYAQPWVIDSAAFLAAPAEQQAARTRGDVLVIGGGSAAMDVARTARRLGRAVTVLTLEPEGQLPAQRIELDEAREEGVGFVTGAMMQSAEAAGDSVSVGCIRVDFSPGDAPGAFDVAPRPGTGFTLAAGTIIPAIGQDADLARWRGALAADGPVIATAPDGQTGLADVFAGGDLASLERFVTHAVGMGKGAARAIAARLDPGLARPAPPPVPLVGYDRINIAYHGTHARSRQRATGVAARLAGFDEVQQPLAADAARSEAARCFSCGTCIYCDNCYLFCPDMAIIKHDGGYAVNTDYCKGCGLCVAECPTGSIHMQEELSS